MGTRQRSFEFERYVNADPLRHAVVSSNRLFRTHLTIDTRMLSL